MNCKNPNCNQPMHIHESNGRTVAECTNLKCDFRYITREPAFFQANSIDDIYSLYGSVIKPYSEPVEINYVYVSRTDKGIVQFATLSDAILEIAPNEAWNESTTMTGMYVSESGKRIIKKES